MNEANQKRKISPKKIVINIVSIITMLSSIFLCFSIYRISGIENTIRYFGIFILILINLLLILVSRKLWKAEKKSQKTIGIIINIILIFSQVLAGFLITKTYNSLDSMNKNKITYTSVIATKKESKLTSEKDLKDKKIGIVTDETSIDGYIIGLEIIKEQNLKEANTVVEYEDLSTLVKDLYNK